MKRKEYNEMLKHITRPTKSSDADVAQKKLEQYAIQPNHNSKYYQEFVERRKKEHKTDKEINNFTKNYQPHKQIQQPNLNKNTLLGGNGDEWLLHTLAMYGEEESVKFSEHLIEDVQIEPNGEMRGKLNNKLYNAMEAIKMNDKYDRNFTNPKLGEDKSTYLTANEKILANYNPTEALAYTNGGKDQENVKYIRYVKAKDRRIENASKNKKNFQPEIPKLFEDIIDNLGKDGPKKSKTTLLTDEQKKDPKIIEMPLPDFKKEIERMEKEKENKEEAYQIKIPREDTRLTKLMLESELAKAEEATSGIGKFDSRSQKILTDIEAMIRKLNGKG